MSKSDDFRKCQTLGNKPNWQSQVWASKDFTVFQKSPKMSHKIDFQSKYIRINGCSTGILLLTNLINYVFCVIMGIANTLISV